MKPFLTKNEIIEAAIGIAREKGWEKTSVREISRAINYSTIKIYSEFKSKEDLLKVIQERGFVMLKNEYIKGIQSKNTSEEKLIELTISHYKFAIHQNTYYDLMFQMNGSTCALPSGKVLQNASEPIRQLLSDVAGSKVSKALFFHWWALTHGFITITRTHKTGEQESQSMLRTIIMQFVKGIKA